jgi:hypothetical protein
MECKKAIGASAKIHESFPHRVEFASGGRIVFETLDSPDAGRGFTWNGVVFDEASLIKQAAFYEVIQPILADSHGWFLGIFTPKGHNWVWQEAIKAEDNPEAQAWQVPTLGVEITAQETLARKPHPLENPDFYFSEAVKLFESQPRRIFEQEFLAQYIDESGGVFRNIRACCTASPDIPENHKEHHIVMGGDWGQSNDFTALGAYCVTCNREVEIDRFNQISWAVQRARVRGMYERWSAHANVSQILLELNSIGSPNVEALQMEGLPVVGFETTAQSKPQLVQSLVLALEKKERTFINDPVTIGELEAYEEKRSTITGRPQYSAPEGMHDDTCIRACLENWAITNQQWLLA